MNPHKAFHELGLFKVILALGFGLFLFTTGFQFYLLIIEQFNINTLNDLLFNVFKVPVSILGVTITAVAIMAALHRSSQLSVQIKLASEQNNFSNYYKHLEEFEKYIVENKLLSNAYEVDSIKFLHKRIWPNFKNGDYSISIEHLDSIKFLFGVMIEELYEVPDKINDRTFPLSLLKQSRTDLERLYYLKEKKQIGSEELIYEGHVLPCINLANDICQILSFEYVIESDETFSKILELSKTRAIENFSNTTLVIDSWIQNPKKSLVDTLKIGVIGTIELAYQNS